MYMSAFTTGRGSGALPVASGRRPAEWENPECFGIGREEARASHCAAESREAALAGRAQSGRYLSLNGR